MPRVEAYDFGRIKVDGKEYARDIIILPSGEIIPEWWREEGHRLRLADLGALRDAEMDVLVIGTGYYGFMKVDPEVVEHFKKKGVEVLVLPSKEAVEAYNRAVASGRRAALAIHLTC